MGITKLQLNTDLLEDCSRVRVRARQLDAAVVSRYAEAKRAGAIFPLPVIFREKGTERYVIADGHHRIAAERELGTKKIEVELREGDETDALEFALGCNAMHGLPRTPADVKRCVASLMTNEDLLKKFSTNKQRAELLRVVERTFHRYVAEWRDEDSGTKKERAAKEKSRERADSNTPNKIKAAKAAAQHSTPKPEPKTEEARKDASAGSSSSGAAAARSPAPGKDKSPRPAAKASSDAGWTAADEKATSAILDALEVLGSAWKSATRAAQIQTADKAREMLKSML